MANTPRFSDAAVNAEAGAFAALLDNGYLRIYDGAQPADADSEPGAQVLLAELRFAAPAFTPAIAGLLVANPIATDVDATASGTATWFRAAAIDGRPVMDGSAGLADADCILDKVAIDEHAEVGCTSFTLQLSKGS